jgi:protein TonB
VALAAKRHAKIAAKSARGIGLTTSLVIHAGIVCGWLVWGTASDGVPLGDSIPVDILTLAAVAPPAEEKPVAIQAVGTSVRSKNRTRSSATVKLAPPVRVDIQPLGDAQRAPLAVTAAAPPEPSPEESAAVAGAGSPAGRVLPETAATVPPALVAAGANDTGAVAEIVRRLRSVAASCYPYAAVRSNLQGTTRLRFCVDQTGAARDAQVVDSSGSAILDSAALDCVLDSAAPFPATSRTCLTVPVRFELQR